MFSWDTHKFFLGSAAVILSMIFGLFGSMTYAQFGGGGIGTMYCVGDGNSCLECTSNLDCDGTPYPLCATIGNGGLGDSCRFFEDCGPGYFCNGTTCQGQGCAGGGDMCGQLCNKQEDVDACIADGGTCVGGGDTCNCRGGGTGSSCTLEAVPSSGLAPLSVVGFTINSDGGTYNLDPGNGDVPYLGSLPAGQLSIGLDPDAIYATTGIYTATLTIGSQTCTAQIEVLGEICGDGVVTGAEDCDDGGTVDGNGCSSTCQYEVGVCSVSFTPSNGIAPVNGSYSILYTAFFANGSINFGDGGTGTLNMPAGTGSHTYAGTGSFTGTVTLQHPFEKGPNATCTYTVTSDYTACGTSLPTYIYTGFNPQTEFGSSMCAGGGTVTGLVLQSGQWTWECEGPGGVVAPQTCSLPVTYCGDGSTNTGEPTYLGRETCDDGNTSNADGCTSTCVREIPQCTIAAVPNPTYSGQETIFTIGLTGNSTTGWVNYGVIYYGDNTSPDVGNEAQSTYSHRYQSGGNYTATFTVYNEDNISVNQTCLLNIGVDYCGDSDIQGAELCDGANLNGATCQSLGYVGGTLSCASSCGFDESQCISVTAPTVTKVAQPTTIQGSTGTYLVAATWNPSVNGTLFTLVDTITPANGDYIIGYSVAAASGVSTHVCSLSGTDQLVCDVFLTNPLSGGQLSLLVDVYFDHGGDEPVVNSVEVCSATECASAGPVELAGYDLTIDKRYYTGYNSSAGGGINTYPSARLLSGDIDDGDWVVYRVQVTNNGDEDAWSPVVTDTLGTGLTIIDILSETNTSSATPTINWAPGGNSWTTNFVGKFAVGATYTVEFSAIFNASGGVTTVCNDAIVAGATSAQEKNPSDNSEQVCLDVLPCGLRSCEAEIYAVDVTYDNSIPNTFTAEGFCRVEGTCGLSDYIAMDGVLLTYEICNGTYTDAGGGSVLVSTTHDGDLYTNTSIPPGLLSTHIEGLIAGWLNEGYDFADVSSLVVTPQTATSGIFTYACRYGDPYLTCDQQTCNAGIDLDQSWTIGGDAWTHYGNLQNSLPSDGDQGSGSAEILSGELICNTCGDNGGGGDQFGACSAVSAYYTGQVPTETDACAAGQMVGLTQSGSNRTWQCVGEQTTAGPCTAQIKWCGDGDSGGAPDSLSGSTESCDYGSGVNGTNGCTTTCQFAEVFCTSVVRSGINGVAPVSLTGTFGGGPNGRYQYSGLNRGDGSPIIASLSTGIAYGTSYTTDGVYTASVVVFNPLNPIVPTYMKTCEHVTIVSSLDIDAVCGSASGENYYAENYIMTQLDAPDFCGVGQLELGPTAIGSGIYTWTCDGINSGASITCQANEDRCSDGAVQSGAYANTLATEECDDTNLTNGDGCTALCQYEEVGFSLNKQQLSFSGSLITYRVSGTVSAGTGSFTITDVLTTGAGGAEITGAILQNITGPLSIISAPSIGGGGDSWTTTIQKNAPLNQSGTFSFDFTVYANEGGDKEICDEVTLTPSVGSDIVRTVCSEGYDIQVEKRVLTGYDSLTGVVGFNTYPGSRLTSGTIADGDWLVYEVVITNNGSEDAWEVFMDETLPLGMEVVEYLGAKVQGTTDISGLTPPDIAPGSTAFTMTIPGKFYVGDSVTFSYRVKFDNATGTRGSGDQICNEVQAWGETNPDPDRLQANNETGVCLNLLGCSATQDCAAEVYGQEFLYTQILGASGIDLTLSTECQIEGTCDMATGFVANATVTYQTCSVDMILLSGGATVSFAGIPGYVSPLNTNIPSCGGNCTDEVQALIASHFNAGVYDFANPISLGTANSNGNHTFDCRAGQYILTCTLPEESCGDVVARWYVGGADWTNPGSVVEPAAGSTDDGVASSNPTWAGQCDTCNNDGGICGDNMVDPGEDCDGGPSCTGGCMCGDGTVPCNGSCVPAGTGACTGICGDGIKEPAEGCDDGNTLSGDGCSATCTPEGGASNLGVIKSASSIIGSTGYFFIDITRGPGEIGTVIDLLTQNPNADVLYSYEITSQTNVTGTCSGAGGTGFTCTNLDLINDTIGGAMSIQVTMQLLQGGDDDVCDRVTVSQLSPSGATLYAYSNEVCLEMYNLDVQKSYLTAYDSLYGNVGINTYPGTTLANGDIADGDRVVYVVTGRNSGPQDAWNPVITDTMEAGLILIDILSVTSPLPYTFTSLTQSGFVVELDGKFLVNQTATFVFLARFDQQAPGYAGSPICNDAEIIGENPTNEQSLPNNQTGVCLNVLPCGVRTDCSAEIYGKDFVLTNTGPTLTMTGFCQVEGTCGSAEELPTNIVSLTYGTCNGSYAVSGSTELTIITSSGSATLIDPLGWSASNIETEVINAVGGRYTDNDGYEFADTANISPSVSRNTPSGSFDFPCRLGNPYLTCTNTNTCVLLDQRRPIGGPSWTLQSAVTEPIQGSQAPFGNGDEVNYTCDTCAAGFCGDGTVDPGEACDGSANCTSCACDSGFIGSGGVCVPSGPSCGDGFIGTGEQCEPSIYTGAGACLTPQCCIDVNNNTICDSNESFCGDGTIQTPNGSGINEQCEPSTYTGAGVCLTPNCCIDLNNDSICDNVSGGGCTADTDCDNGLFCDGNETCNLTTNTCVSGTSVVCNDGISCSTDSCNETTNSCVFNTDTCTFCGDGTVQTPNGSGFNEQCEWTGSQVSLGCTNACMCGSGYISTGGSCQPSCGADNMCNLVCTTDPDCDNRKSIVNISGNSIQYLISGSASVGTTGVTMIDTLSGASYITGSFALSMSQGSGSLSTLISGPSAIMTLTNTTTGAMRFGINYTVLANRSGTSLPVCNSIQVRNESNQVVGTGSSICVCPSGSTYNSGTNTCVVDSLTGSVCTAFTVTPTVVTGGVYSGTYQCAGSGTNYLIDIYSGTQLIQTYAGSSGAIAFTGGGVYTAYCRVDNDTGVMCGGETLSIQAIQLLGGQLATNLDAITTGYIGQVNRSGLVATLATGSIVDVSESVLTQTLQTNVYAYFLSQMVLLYPPIPATTPLPNVLLNALQQVQVQLNMLVQAQVIANCTETCEQTLVLGGSGGSLCQDLTTTGAVVINSPTHSLQFTCLTAVSGLNTVLSCGNGTSGTIYTGVSSALGSGMYGITGTCAYTGYATYIATCSVEGTTQSACQETVLLRSGGGGSSGGGSSGGGSSGGGNSGGGSSGGGSSGGGGSGGGGGSSSCARGGIIDAKYCVDNEPKCTEIDPPSVMQGEYLPFRWDLDLGDEVDVTASSCSDLAAGKTIPGDSLLCTFELYNGATKQPIAKIEQVPCLEDRWNDTGVMLFDDFKKSLPAGQLGSSWIELTEQLTKGIVGEYQIALTEVAYATCAGTSSSTKTYKGVNDERICAMNFAVADGYLIHQGTSFSTLADTNLRMFRKVDGRAVLDRETLRRVQQSLIVHYPGDVVKQVVSKRTDQQTSRATQSAQLGRYTTEFVKKVPNQRIYVYDGGPGRAPFRLRGGSAQDAPMTVIIRNADVLVEGSLLGRHMYVVPEGKVTFINTNCDQKDTVQGIWMSAGGFATHRIRNDRLGERDWCDDGRLVIEGMAVGPGIDTEFVEMRRAVLADWFDITVTSQEQKVFTAASVLIKTDPKIRSQLPPGADAFIREVSIKR